MTLTCPICNKQFKKIDTQHLRKHSLSLPEYLETYGADAPFGYSPTSRAGRSGENHPLFGVGHTQEAKDNVSAGLRRMWSEGKVTERQRRAIGERSRKLAEEGNHFNHGRKHVRTDEYCQALSSAIKAYYQEHGRSQEHSAAISKAKQDKPLSVEHRRAISDGINQFHYGDLGPDYAEKNAYFSRARDLTEQTYELHKAVLNPENVPRGKKEWHLDHIVPIIVCFRMGWTPAQAAHVSNLQLLRWDENLRKATTFSPELFAIIEAQVADA